VLAVPRPFAMNNTERFILEKIDLNGQMSAAALVAARYQHTNQLHKKVVTFTRYLKSLAARGFLVCDSSDHLTALWSRATGSVSPESHALPMPGVTSSV